MIHLAAAKDPARTPNLALIGTIEVVPGRRDELLALLIAHRARCLRDEPGTLQFEVLAPCDDDSKVLVYEVFRDEAAFEAHRNAPSLALWREQIAGMVVKITGTRCELVE